MSQTSGPPCYLAFDLGASSGRVVVGRLQADRMQMEEVHRFATPLVEREGHLWWDLGGLHRLLAEGVRRALRSAPQLRSLSTCSWAVDYVPLDEGGAPLRDPYAYRDKRTSGLMEKTLRSISEEEIYRTTGIQFLPINTLYQVLADKEQEPEQFRRTKSRLLIADYFNYRMSGRAAAEASMASTTQLMDVRRRRWSHELMQRLGLLPEAWPEIVPSGTRLGKAHAAPNVEVVAGLSHDTACAVAAVPAAAEDPRWAYISCGTWSLLGVELEEPVLTDAAREAGFTNEAGLDGSIRFLKNLTGLWPLQECMRAWRRDGPASYEAVLDAAAEAPAHLAAIDLEDERFLARGDMPERLAAYCRETGQPLPESRGQWTRVILESIAESYRRALRELETLTGRSIETLHLVGGGVRNPLLCRLAADATGRPVVAGPAEATALGNLLVQARTLGDLPAGCTLRDMARASVGLETYPPQKKTA